MDTYDYWTRINPQRGCGCLNLQGRQARSARTTAARRLLGEVVPLQIGAQEDALGVPQVVLTCSCHCQARSDNLHQFTASAS